VHRDLNRRTFSCCRQGAADHRLRDRLGDGREHADARRRRWFARHSSPGEVRGAAVTPATDVFAFGATLAYGATADSPFGQGSSEVMLYRVVHEEPESGGRTGRAGALVYACLAKDPGTAEHRAAGRAAERDRRPRGTRDRAPRRPEGSRSPRCPPGAEGGGNRPERPTGLPGRGVRAAAQRSGAGRAEPGPLRAVRPAETYGGARDSGARVQVAPPAGRPVRTPPDAVRKAADSASCGCGSSSSSSSPPRGRRPAGVRTGVGRRRHLNPWRPESRAPP